MHIYYRPLIAGLALLALGAGPQESQDMEALIQKLGASDIAVREAATRDLLAKGQAGRPALEKASRNPDGEIAARAKAILATLDRDVDALALVLERIRKEAGDSYQRMLQDSTHALRIACEGKDVDAISKSLDRQGFPLQKKRFFHEVNEYLAKEGAYVAPSGLRHDLRLRLELAPQTSKTEATKWIVKGTVVELIARPAAEFAGLAAKAYPAGTVLQYAIEDKVSKEAAENFPILTEIRIVYNLGKVSHRDETSYWGFHVVVEFANRSKTAGTSTMFFVQSGLDPSETGGVKDDAGFVSADTWEPMWASGGGGWQKGTGQMSRTLKRVKDGEEEDDRDKKEPVEVRSVGDIKALPETTSSILIRGSDLLPEECAELIRLTGLRSLEWGDQAKIPESAYEHLAKLKTLEEIDLVSHSEPTDECLRLLSGMTRLKKVRLTATSQLTDAGVAHLARLADLRELSLWWCEGLTDATLKRLGEHKNLETLHLWGSKGMTDAGLEALSKSNTLKTLTLSHSHAITVRGWGQLEKLTTLRSLTLGCTSLGDSGLVAIGRIPNLEELSLDYLKEVTDAGLPHLKGLKLLRRLHLNDCPGITTAGLKELQAALPGKYKLD